MKIAIFTDTYFPDINGVANTLRRFTEHLDKSNHQYRIFTPKNYKHRQCPDKIHTFPSLPFLLYPECRFSIPNPLDIHAELKKFNPDIIHVATPFNVGLCGIYYAQKHNIPLVGSYHTDFDKYLGFYNLKMFEKALWKYLLWFHQPMSRLFVPSLDTYDKLKKRGFTYLRIWGRGVDSTLFHPNYTKTLIREKYQIEEKYIISYVGRLAPEKNLDVIFKIMNHLPEDMNNNIHWLMVGDGPLKKSLMELSRPNVTFTGYLQGTDLAEVYSNSDLFLFPSTTETFGNVVLESLASRTPVIGASAGGVKHIVRNNIHGVLCQPNNLQTYIEAITYLLSNAKITEEMANNARAFALKRSWGQLFDTLLDAYSEVIDERLTTQIRA